jgi:Flp pilus assembly pilin Flp
MPPTSPAPPAGISLVIIAAVNGIGTKLGTKFDNIDTSLK